MSDDPPPFFDTDDASLGDAALDGPPLVRHPSEGSQQSLGLGSIGQISLSSVKKIASGASVVAANYLAGAAAGAARRVPTFITAGSSTLLAARDSTGQQVTYDIFSDVYYDHASMNQQDHDQLRREGKGSVNEEGTSLAGLKAKLAHKIQDNDSRKADLLTAIRLIEDWKEEIKDLSLEIEKLRTLVSTTEENYQKMVAEWNITKDICTKAFQPAKDLSLPEIHRLIRLDTPVKWKDATGQKLIRATNILSNTGYRDNVRCPNRDFVRYPRQFKGKTETTASFKAYVKNLVGWKDEPAQAKPAVVTFPPAAPEAKDGADPIEAFTSTQLFELAKQKLREERTGKKRGLEPVEESKDGEGSDDDDVTEPAPKKQHT